MQVYPGNGTLASTGTNSWQYTYALPTEPPTGTDATHVEIRVESDSPYTGTDSVGTQTSNGPAEGRSDMIKAVTTPVGSNPFGDGDFRYSNSASSDKVFGGSVELLNGATHDDLTDLSFTVRDASGYQFVVPTDNINSSGSYTWVGFNYPESEVPASLVEPATVTVSATYEGNTYSKTFDVEFAADPAPITMDVWDTGVNYDAGTDFYSAQGLLHFHYDANTVSYETSPGNAVIEWYSAGDDFIGMTTLTAGSDITYDFQGDADGDVMYEFTASFQAPEASGAAKFLITVSASVTNTGTGETDTISSSYGPEYIG